MNAARTLPLFRASTRACLYLLTGSVACLILADISYVNGDSIREVLSSKEIRSAVWLTLTTSTLSTALSLVVAVPAGYCLSRFPFRGMMILDVLVDLLIVVPVLVVGVSLLVFFRVGSDLGQASFAPLRPLGRAVAAAGEFFIYQRPGIVLAQFFCSVSFAVRTIKATFDQIDPRTEQIAMTLGCTHARAFLRTTLPLSRHGIFAAGVLAWARAFGLFGPVSVVAGSVRGKTEVLSTAIFLEISIGRLEVALAVSLLMLAMASLTLVALRMVTGGGVFGTGHRS